jgi:hypothetical protein
MLRRFLFLAVLSIILASIYGAAASLEVFGGTIQAGLDADLTCDRAIRVVDWGLNTDTEKVHYVKIGGIAPACYGSALHVKVLDAGNGMLAKGSFDPVNRSRVTIHFNPPADPAAITKLKVWIESEAP